MSEANRICRDDRDHVFVIDAVRFAHRHPTHGLPLFADVGRFLGRCAAPIDSVPSFFDVSMECGVRPIGDAFCPSVFDRVVVDVVDVGGHVGIVSDLVFPESSLPDTAFAATDAADAPVFGLGQGAGESGLDQTPANADGVIAWRQRPDGVQVFGQDRHGVNAKRMLLFDPAQ